MSHNEYLFSTKDSQFRFLRRFEDMYRNCEDPHGQSHELQRADYQVVLGVLNRAIACLRRIPGAPVRILDVGCGLGFFTAQLKHSFPDAEVHGCDISETAVAKATAMAQACEFYTIDLKAAAPATSRTYDVLVAMHVLCYFTDEEIHAVVNRLHAMLDPGGYVMVGHHLPPKMSFGRFIQGLDSARSLFAASGLAVRVGIDMHNELDLTYANDPVGRNLYFLAQKAG
jgi:2-polyprenyl-3-methyl-5-hydroxy-6-metoxy-1,4-benzoquinol methylase